MADRRGMQRRIEGLAASAGAGELVVDVGRAGPDHVEQKPVLFAACLDRERPANDLVEPPAEQCLGRAVPAAHAPVGIELDARER